MIMRDCQTAYTTSALALILHTVYIATAENIENPTNNLIPHLLERKGFYGNVIVSVNRGNKIRKCYLKKKINVKPHFRNGSSVEICDFE